VYFRFLRPPHKPLLNDNWVMGWPALSRKPWNSGSRSATFAAETCGKSAIAKGKLETPQTDKKKKSASRVETLLR
jgi:hypothetical protein